VPFECAIECVPFECVIERYIKSILLLNSFIAFCNDFNNKIRYVTVVVDNDSYPPSEISEFVVCKYYEKV
jgi:hypothetical protein